LPNPANPVNPFYIKKTDIQKSLGQFKKKIKICWPTLVWIASKIYIIKEEENLCAGMKRFRGHRIG
jgi:hypothetical protein